MKVILPMKLRDLKTSGHWPTLLTAFLYFDFSFMVWTLLGALGVQIAETLQLNEIFPGVPRNRLHAMCRRVVTLAGA